MDCLQDVVSAQGPQIANDCIEGLMSTNGMHGQALLITVRRRRCSSPRQSAAVAAPIRMHPKFH